MITVEEASNIILNQDFELQNESVPLVEADGRILMQSLSADRDFPPFNRVMMDGIALRFDAFQSGQRMFKIEDVAAAGAPIKSMKNESNCLEVMTGAVLPVGTDVVIRYEDLKIENGECRVNLENISLRQNIHAKGKDRKQGELLLPFGKKISPAEIALAATIGLSELQVKRKLKVAIISTGDELVEVHEKPLAHQIRRSNVYNIASALKNYGADCETFHLLDEEESMKEKLAELLNTFDTLVLSGGVSMGKFDFVPKVLKDLGVEKLFHKVKQRPGKPFWFGRNSKGVCVFGLPGNPVSSFVCTVRYLQPWMSKIHGLEMKESYAILKEPMTFKPDLKYFLQVKVEETPGGFRMAKPIGGNGSGDLANLVEVDGFLELERGKDEFEVGEVFRYWGFR